MRAFATAYSAKDAHAISLTFTENAVTDGAMGRAAIERDYAELFSTPSDAWVVWDTYNNGVGNVLTHNGWVENVTITFEDKLISRMTW